MSSSIEFSAPFALLAKEVHFGAVCQILKQEEGEQVDAGTGFLIGHRLLITCQHVVQTVDRIEKYSTNFNYSGGLEKCFIAQFEREQTYSSSPSPGNNAELDNEHLDFRILHLKDHPELRKIAKCAFTKIAHPKLGDRANIIHHAIPEETHPTRFPGLKQYVRGNPITEIEDNGTIHYTTEPLEFGASGAPVFDDEGNLLAIHRGRCDRHANCREGVSITKIFESLSITEKTLIRKAADEAERLTTFQHKINNIHRPPADFTGRKEDLGALDQKVKEHKRVAISGLGGIGKTALALQYVHLHQDEFEHCYFLGANSLELLQTNLINLAEELGVPEKDTLEERLRMLKVQLDRMGPSFLLLIDGIDEHETFNELARYLPNQACILLMTSRQKKAAKDINFTLIKLKIMSKKDATEYLIKAAEKDICREEAEILAERLGYLPLALKHAAAYIRETPGYTFKRYIRDFDEESVRVFEGEQFKFLSCEEKTVLTTWNITTESIKKLEHGHLSLEILNLISCLAHAPIPLELCEKAMSETPLRSINRALRNLENYGFVENVGETLTSHSLVQSVIYSNLSEVSIRSLLNRVISAAGDLSGRIHRHEMKKETINQYLSHMEKVKQNLNITRPPFIHPEKVIAVLNFLRLGYQHSSNHNLALKIAKQLLNICKSYLHEEPMYMALALKQMSVTLRSLGKYDEALEYNFETMKCEKNTLIGNRLEQENLLEIGKNLEDLGRYDEALEYYKKALELVYNCKENRPLLFFVCFKKIGGVLSLLGRNQESLKFLMEALKIGKSTMKKHPSLLAAILQRIGITHRGMGMYEEALQYHKKALEHYVAIHGEQHASIATCLNFVGQSLGDLGRHKEALQHQMAGLRLSINILNRSHPIFQ